MLSNLNNTDIFYFNPLFQWVESPEDPKKEKWFLRHVETEAEVETDQMGKSILDSIPCSLDSLVEKFSNPDGHTYISPKLIRFYLLLFWKSGILVHEEKEDPAHAANHSSFSITPPVETADISAVIVTFNGARFIGPNLETLFKQNLKPSQFIVVDNASTDRTVTIIEQNFPDIHIIRNKKNVHYAAAVNTGVQAAANDLILILNQDLVFEEGFIRNLYRRYIEESDKETAAGVVPQMRFNKLQGFIDGIGNFITEKNWGSDNFFGVVDIGQFEKLAYVGSACFGAVMVTRKAWETVGPLDETYRSFYEDVDWSMRAHLKGMKLLAAPQAIVYHEFGGSYPSGLKLYLAAKNRLRFVIKHLRGKLLRKFLFKYIKMDIKSALAFIRRKVYKNLWYYARAYMKLMVELPTILYRERKNKANPGSIESFFTQMPPYVAFSNSKLDPVINKHVIRSYYYFTEMDDFVFPGEPIVDC